MAFSDKQASKGGAVRYYVWYRFNGDKIWCHRVFSDKDEAEKFLATSEAAVKSGLLAEVQAKTSNED